MGKVGQGKLQLAILPFERFRRCRGIESSCDGGPEHFPLAMVRGGSVVNSAICALLIEFHVQRLGEISIRSYCLYRYVFDVGPNKHGISTPAKIPTEATDEGQGQER